jgi:hypothetical protein
MQLLSCTLPGQSDHVSARLALHLEHERVGNIYELPSWVLLHRGVGFGFDHVTSFDRISSPVLLSPHAKPDSL